jgi:GrpB protein
VEPGEEWVAYPESVLAGDLESADVVIWEHDPDRLRSALFAAALVVEHICSTAVPGLAAEPIIDVLVGVASVEDPLVVRVHLSLESVLIGSERARRPPTTSTPTAPAPSRRADT